MQNTGNDKIRLLYIQKLIDKLASSYLCTETLTQIELENNIPLDYHLILFPGGLYEILLKVEKYLLSLMMENLDALDLPPVRVRDKITKALEVKIIEIIDKKAYVNLLACSLSPKYAISLPKLLYQTTDQIWRYAGDSATDFNHYTKRMILSSVYIKSILFYINDESYQYNDTRLYIREKIEEVVTKNSRVIQFAKKIFS